MASGGDALAPVGQCVAGALSLTIWCGLERQMLQMQHGENLVFMRAVRPLVHAVAAAGVPRAAFLRAAGLDPRRDQSPDARLPRAKLFELFELAVVVTRDPAFGLHSVEALTSEAVSPLGALAVHAMTLRDALRSLEEFRALFAAEASFYLYERNGKVVVRCHRHDDASAVAQRYLDEVALGGLYLLLRRFAVPVDFVSFAYPAPEYQADYARVFERRARFDQPFTGLCFDASWLQAPSPHQDTPLHDALTAHARRHLRDLTGPRPWAERVHELLVGQRPPRDTSMSTSAHKLGVSERSLRRHLTSEGKSYSKVVSDALAAIAKTCLLDERRTIMETAHELGFADNTAFHRAFKRWTGLTPLEYRKTALAGPISNEQQC